jgi:hypothetical protein
MQDNEELYEQLLANTGFVRASKPRYLNVALAARSNVIYAAASRGWEEGEVNEDRSKCCVAELPVGLAPYPPANFTASDQQFTKQWRRSVLSKVDRGAVVGGPPSHSLEEGESVSNGLHWMECALISLRLARGSMQPAPSKDP